MMKKLLALSAVAALLLCSCSIDELEPGIDPDEVTIECITDQCSAADSDADSDGDTKAALSAAKDAIFWNSGDRISVLSFNGGHACFTLSAGANTANGTFTGSISGSSDFYALYPYSSTTEFRGGLHFKKPQQTVHAADNIAAGAFPMVAHVSKVSERFVFRSLMGILELQVKGKGEISKIELTDNDGKILWGDFTVNLNGNEGTNSQSLSSSNSSSAKSTLTYVFSTDGTAAHALGSTESFYFVVPAGSFSAGFTAKFYDPDGTLVKTVKTTKDNTVHRAKIRVMPVVSVTGKIVPDYFDPMATSTTLPMSWAANGSSDSGTVIDPQASGYPAAVDRGERFVGVFYFVNLGCFGYDKVKEPSSYTTTSTYREPTASDTKSPIDIQTSVCGAGKYDFVSTASKYLGIGASHHWGQPYLGFYTSRDSWVIRKHAQMLVDAGVDVIFIDVSNVYTFIDMVVNLSNVYLDIRSKGNKTPQLAFLLNSEPAIAANTLYTKYYKKYSKYKDLWFMWDGKPLMLADKAQIKSEKSHVASQTSDSFDSDLLNFFTFRKSWYIWNKAKGQDNSWWGTGEDKWPWGCYYTGTANPQHAGTHQGKNECVSVMPATHPVSNIGRSYVINKGEPSAKNPGAGTYFKAQFKAAMDLDAKMMFFTGWNEWTAARLDKYAQDYLGFDSMCGKKVTNDVMFVDQYNHEYSRDIEPMKGGFGDNYYYYMCEMIRKFKGVKDTPVYSQTYAINVDGSFGDWSSVNSVFRDDVDDVKARGYDTYDGKGFYGWGKYNRSKYPNYYYKNTTGRNDITTCKVATDGKYLYFYVAANANFTAATVSNFMRLYLKAGTKVTSYWEGFNYRVYPSSATNAVLTKCNGGWSFTTVNSSIPMKISGKQMELRIPLSDLGITNVNDFSLDFKWIDNACASGDIQTCMSDGDSAPNGRFRYRYVFKKK